MDPDTELFVPPGGVFLAAGTFFFCSKLQLGSKIRIILLTKFETPLFWKLNNSELEPITCHDPSSLLLLPRDLSLFWELNY